jgi:hypothetical protein
MLFRFPLMLKKRGADLLILAFLSKLRQHLSQLSLNIVH